MASGTQNNTSYQAQKWTNLRSFTIGETGKNVDGTTNISWSKNEILGVSDDSKFLRGDKTWSNTLTGPFNVLTQTSVDQALSICRGSITEGVRIWVNDSYTNFYVENDETTANVEFRLHATDTESGGGAGENTSYVRFNGENGKSTVTANIFSGALNGHAEAATKLYADDSPYRYTDSHPYYAHMSYNTNGDNRWYLRVYPETPKIIAVDWAYDATKASYLKDKTNGTASYLDYGRAGITSSSAFTWIGVWDGYTLAPASKGALAGAVDESHKWARIGGDTFTGPVRINGTDNSSTDARLYIDHASNNDWGIIINKSTSCDWGINVICKSDGGNGINCSGRITGNKVYGAVWNDYAECRNVNKIIEPGYVVYETKSKMMEKTYERLQPGCKVVSDTYGMCIGETEEAQTPIAVCGRVLVYPYRNRYEYELGAAVCSAPNGTVDIMTREEIMMYPERIIGTVSEIPDYAVWHAGERDGNHEIQVNGRIWIYVH